MLSIFIRGTEVLSVANVHKKLIISTQIIRKVCVSIMPFTGLE